MTPRQFPTIKDNYRTYELNKVDDPLGSHFTAHGQILISPKDYLTITLSGLKELDQYENNILTTLVHPHLLRTQPDRFGNQVISIPINTKLDLVIHVTQVIDEDFISNANYDYQWADFYRLQSGWLACSSYEVIVKSCENNSDPVETTILWEGVTLHVL